jgi:PRTRC genetic system protein C
MAEETRKIRYGDKEFELDPGMTLDQAKALMARHFPELADPEVKTTKENGATVYVFTKRAGHKGATVADRLLRLHDTPVLPQEVIEFAGILLGDDTQGYTYASRHVANALTSEAEEVRRITAGLISMPADIEPVGGLLL